MRGSAIRRGSRRATTATPIAPTKRSGRRRNCTAPRAAPSIGTTSWRTTRSLPAPSGRWGRNPGGPSPTSGCGPMYWAAARTPMPRPQSWGTVAKLGLWTYVLGGGKDADATAAIRRASLAAADQIVERTRSNAYRISMTTRDYIWGSNAVAANYGMQLLVANAFQRRPAYVEAALDNLP